MIKNLLIALLTTTGIFLLCADCDNFPVFIFSKIAGICIIYSLIDYVRNQLD